MNRSRFFSMTLCEHHSLRPVVKAVKSGTKATIPAWQADISAAAVEMAEYEILIADGDGKDLGQDVDRDHLP